MKKLVVLFALIATCIFATPTFADGKHRNYGEGQHHQNYDGHFRHYGGWNVHSPYVYHYNYVPYGYTYNVVPYEPTPYYVAPRGYYYRPGLGFHFGIGNGGRWHFGIGH